MKLKDSCFLLVFIFCIFFISELRAHGNHSHDAQSWLHWFGHGHFIVLHYPIALITSTCISESLFLWKRLLIFDYAARFMIILAAIMSIPTVAFGLLLAYSTNFTDSTILGWHEILGILTAILVMITALLKELGSNRIIHSMNGYYALLIFTLLSVTVTAFLGGKMVFG